MRIVLTRDAAPASALETGLREAGLELGHLPLTQQVLPEDTTELTTAVERLASGDFSWLLLTSGNTVRFLLTAGWEGTVPDRTRVGAVGPGTAAVLTELTGMTEPWMPQQHSAAGILAELPGPQPGERLLLPQSARATALLAESLPAYGWEVTCVEAYRTVPRQVQAQSLGAEDVVLITASSAAEQWTRSGLRARAVLAIGEPTAQTLRTLGISPDAVLAAPTAAGVQAVLEDLR